MRKFSLEQNSGSRYFDYVNCDIHLMVFKFLAKSD